MSRAVLALALSALISVGVFFLLDSDTPGDADVADARGTTDASVIVEAPVPETAPATTTAAARTAEPARAPDEPPPSYVASLGAIIGRIVDHEKVAVPHVDVERLGGNVFTLLPTEEDWFSDTPPDLSFSIDSTKTDVDGRFRFENVDPHGFFLLGIDLGGPRSAYRPVDSMPNPGEVIDLGDIALDPAASIVGRVVDEDGTAVAGARVRASELPVEAFKFGLADVVPGCAVGGKLPGEDEWRVLEAPPIAMALLRRLPYYETRTAEDGTFRLEAVPVGTLSVIADHAEMVTVAEGPVTTRPNEERKLSDLMLFYGDELVGTVVRASERDGEEETEPVEGAEVLVGAPLAIFPAAVLTPGGRTDAEGRFRVEGLRDDPHVVAVRAPDETTWTIVERISPGLDEPVIRLGPTHALTVTARDELGEVVAGPRVLVQANADLDIGDLGMASFLVAPPLPMAGKTRTLESGAVRITGLSPAKYRVLVKSDGHASTETEVDLRDGSTTADVTLPREVEASVRVVAAGTGKPIEWALVSAFDDNADGAEEDVNFLPLVTRRTDDNGVAFLDGLLAGNTRVRVFHPAFAMAESSFSVPGPPAIIELSGGGSLAGTVTQDGFPVATPHWVFAIPVGGGDTPLPRITRTGEDGTYELTHLRAGLYSVTVTDRFGDDNDGGGGSRMRLGGGPPGESGGGSGGTNVSFTFGATVGGGAPESVESAETTAAPESGTDFSLADGFGPDSRQALIVEGERTILDVDTMRLEGAGPRARLLGRVYLNGAPADALTVTAHSERAGRNGRSATTGRTGMFDIGEVPIGKTAVRVMRGDGKGTFAEKIVNLEASAVEEVEFRITTGRVNGKVRSVKERGALPFTTVVLQQQGTQASQETSTDGAGAFSFDLVPEGEYVVIAEAKGHVRAITDPFAVPAGRAAAPIRIELTGSVTVSGEVEIPPNAGLAPYIFVYFEPNGDDEAHRKSGFGGFAFVDPETRTFEVDDVAPGPYSVQIFGAENDLAPIPFEVPSGGASGALLRPEVAESN